MDNHETLPIGVLISGGGTTLRNLIQLREAGRLAVDIRVVVSSNPNAGGLEFARNAEITTHIAERGNSPTPDDYRDAVFGPCREADVKLVVMGGFLKHVLIPNDFAGRVINIHPSLIPAFCGQGYYGRRVHQAVLDYGARITGCTVHFVDDQYDHGPIILQKPVPVADDDTPETLAARVFAEECRVLPEAIRLFSARRLRIEGRRVLLK